MPTATSLPQWQAYFSGQAMLETQASPTLSFVEPMLRRRLSRLSRLLLAAARPCADHASEPYQLVFANQHGELNTTVQLLQSLALGETPSPMGFSLSVHNTAAGLYSIAQACPAPSSALAAGPQTLFAALIEAYSRLHNGVEQVVVAYAEEPLPALLQAYQVGQPSCLALGLLLQRANGFSLSLTPQLSSLDLIAQLTAQAADRYALLA
jgi:hypothetical protein